MLKQMDTTQVIAQTRNDEVEDKKIIFEGKSKPRLSENLSLN